MVQPLNATVLAELAAMDDYDRILNMDRIAAAHGMTAADLDAALAAHLRGETVANVAEAPPTAPASTPAPTGAAAQRITDASRYRATYDPSPEGQARQANVQEAIVCPACNAALGIPAVRPIKVKCPSCLMDHTFTV